MMKRPCDHDPLQPTHEHPIISDTPEDREPLDSVDTRGWPEEMRRAFTDLAAEAYRRGGPR